MISLNNRFKTRFFFHKHDHIKENYNFCVIHWRPHCYYWSLMTEHQEGAAEQYNWFITAPEYMNSSPAPCFISLWFEPVIWSCSSTDHRSLMSRHKSGRRIEAVLNLSAADATFTLHVGCCTFKYFRLWMQLAYNENEMQEVHNTHFNKCMFMQL